MSPERSNQAAPVEGSARYERALRAHSTAMARGAECTRCPLFGSRQGPVQSVSRRSKLLILAESPGEQEVLEEEPLVGPTGRVVMTALADAEWLRSDSALINVIECRPPDNYSLEAYEKKLKRQNQPKERAHARAVKEWRAINRTRAKQGKKLLPEPKPSATTALPTVCCRPRLLSDLKKVKPSVILSLGAFAFSAIGALTEIPIGGKKKIVGEIRLANLAAQRGHPFFIPASRAKVFGTTRNVTLLPTYHPSYAMHGAFHMAHRIAEDITRAGELAHRNGRPKYRVPRIDIEPTMKEAIRWCRIAKKSRARITVDIETGPRQGHDPEDGLHVHALIRCVNLTYGPEGRERTMVVPFFRKSGRMYWENHRTFRRVWNAVRELLEANPLTFHNGYAFDVPRLVHWGFMDERPRKDLRDTILMHHASREQSNPHDLGYLIGCFFDAVLHKGDVDHKAAGGHEADRILWIYGGQDSIGTARVERRLRQWIRIDETEHTVKDDHHIGFNILSRMNARPLLIDNALRETASRLLGQRAEKLTAKIRDLLNDPDFNPNSPPQVGRYLYETKGLEPVLNTEGREFDAEREDNASTSVVALLALEDSGLLSDDVAKFIDYQIRFKTADKLKQMVNSVEGEISPEFGDAYRLLWVVWKLHVTPSQRLASSPNVQNVPKIGLFNMRYLFRAPPGYKWVGADKEQIEARLSAMVMPDPTALLAFRQGKDIHAVNAATLFARNIKQEQEIYDEIVHKRGEYKKNKALIEQIKADLAAEEQSIRRQYGDKVPKHVAQNLKDAWADKLKWCQQLADDAEWAELVRRVAKYFIYLETYGGEEEKLAQTFRTQRDKSTGERLFTEEALGRNLEEAVEEWHRLLHERRPCIRQWQRRVTEHVWRTGRNKDFIQNRWRYYLGRPNKKNAPMNHEIQTGATGIVNDEMKQLVEVIGWGTGAKGCYWGRHSGFKEHGHDYLGFWVKEERAEEFARHVNRVMNRTIKYNGIEMPFPAEAVISDTLGDQ